MSVFIDRERELSLLNKRFGSNRAEFVIIYGRRRIGKSELIDQFINNDGIRLLAREESKTLQLRTFAEKLGDFFGDELLRKTEFTGWDGFFEYLYRKADERIIIAIDEFPAQRNKTLPDTLRFKHLDDGIEGDGLQKSALWKKNRATAPQADPIYAHTGLHRTL
jgi:AAA+ ATPase superfamily predicted ATPase